MQERAICSACGGPSMIVNAKSAASRSASFAMFSRAMLTTWKAGSSRRLAHVLAEPCLSASISRTLWPLVARAAATLIERVVLPTPPFWLRKEMIMNPHCRIRGYEESLFRTNPHLCFRFRSGRILGGPPSRSNRPERGGQGVCSLCGKTGLTELGLKLHTARMHKEGKSGASA